MIRLRSLVSGLSWVLGVCSLLGVAAVGAQTPDPVGQPITEVRVQQEGKPVTDRLIAELIDTKVGQPLSMQDVRESIDHLHGVGRFDDIQVSWEPLGTGVRVTYVLVPRHAVQSVEFRGRLELPERELRQAMTARFGALPPVSRTNDVARTLSALYRERGYLQARVDSSVQELHDPDRAIVTFTIDAGAPALIRSVEIKGLDGADAARLQAEVDARAGRPYDSVALQERLDRYERDFRARGYYEARVRPDVAFTADGQAVVVIAVERGPHVSIAYAGDPLPQDAREDLVPLQREGSVDEDLLEDAERAIEDYLHARGYRDADVRHTREQKGDELVITFASSRGARHVIDNVDVKGNRGIASAELLQLVGTERGEPFVEATVERGVDAITQLYRARGFRSARVEPVMEVLPRPAGSTAAADRRVLVTFNVSEGPRTIVATVAIEGNTVFTEGHLRSAMTTAPGRPYSDVEVEQDVDRVRLEYLNLGYESIVVTPHPAFADGDTRADLRLSIAEGPQVLVDRVIIVGNRRTSTETIQRAVLLEPGEPLGYAARAESQQRLAALGLFRRFSIVDLPHGSEPRRDILVEVDEAPPTTVGYGGGLEGGTRLRPTGAAGQAEERFDLAPRGFFEIGRRNLFGKNRSVNLFTRVALKTRDAEDLEPIAQGDYGFNEYRVLAAYREPRVFDTPADVVVTGTLDQAIRSSFSFRSRELRAEAGFRLAQRYGVAGRYSFEQNEVFDEHFTEEDEELIPLIDRLFPEVRLSKFSVSLFRDTRNDALDPDRGTFLSADNDLATRSIGSEVGFVQTSLQAAAFRRLPSRRRMVLRLRGLLGMAQGFERRVEQFDANGQPVIVSIDDLPASERFFAGGDTSVRGFSLDRLGTAETITPSGFPTGGNGVIVLNGELLVNVWRALDMVGFLDGGNVFPRVRNMDFTELRAAAGFGVRYRSPVGPVRIDLGFNLDPRELVPGSLERRTVLHVSLGQAF